VNKNNNYWSPLSCRVKEQEGNNVEHTSAKHFLSAVTDFQPSKLQNKMAANGKGKYGTNPEYWTQAAHWVRVPNTTRIVFTTPASRLTKYSCSQTRQGSEHLKKCG
jgi:hypothetical protein